MHFYYKKQKSFFAFFIICEFFVTSVVPASAGLFGVPSIPSPSSIMSDMEQRYHLDPAALQNQGETMNVLGNKGLSPEVSLSFSPSDPKEGEKITAKAFPIYFSNTEVSMYYTWFLKRKGCDLGSTNNDNKSCDVDGKDGITVEDWKLTATKILVQNGYDPSVNLSSSDPSPLDDDGYFARFGGDNKDNVPDYCYVTDVATGKNYELQKNVSSSSFGGCASTEKAVCLTGIGSVNETALDITTTSGGGASTGGDAGAGGTSTSGSSSCVTDGFGITTCTSGTGTGTSGSGGTGGSGTGGSGAASGVGPVVSFSDTGKCAFSGFPSCSSSVASCATGTLQCVNKLARADSCGTAYPLSGGVWACSASTAPNPNKSCSNPRRHLFPNGSLSGDGAFGVGEETFWGTNPKDPSTSDNGNKDEANVVGLGQSSLTWTYQIGDKVGVSVEGTSMFFTKHDDSSTMTMWAFSKKDCPFSRADGTGSYLERIKGYMVEIPTVDFDLNKCIGYIDNKGKVYESSLVDPTEGGQATNLSISVSATPKNPINDPGSDKSGDVVLAQATVDNAAQNQGNILFDWKVSIGRSIGSFTDGTAKNITSDLRDLKLLGNTKGNALDTIKLKLDIPSANIASYLGAVSDTGYLKFQATATENFSGTAIRKGVSDVIIKFISTDQIVTAYGVNAALSSDTMKVNTAGPICDVDPLERTVCRVIKNEIIGLKVDGTGLSNFNWTINGSPLLCTARVSSDCAAGGGSSTVDKESQGNINYFPVSGNVGDTYTVTVTANDIASGKIVTLTRSFNVVEPKVVIKSTSSDAWQKFLGQYKDISGSINPATGLPTCPNGLCDDLSESIYQTYSGSNLAFKAAFIPGFLSNSVTTKKEWSIDTDVVQETSPGVISFTADKQVGGMYTISFLAQVTQPDNIRKALLDIWGISPFDSPEINFASSIQVEVQAPLLTEGPLSGPRKYYAAIASYIPASVLFTFRIFLSVALTLFALSLLNSLLEERRLEAFVRSFSRSRDK